MLKILNPFYPSLYSLFQTSHLLLYRRQTAEQIQLVFFKQIDPEFSAVHTATQLEERPHFLTFSPAECDQVYQFSMAIITSQHKLSKLEPHKFVISWFSRSEAWVSLAGFSPLGFTKSQSKCWLPRSFWKDLGEITFKLYQVLAETSSLNLQNQDSVTLLAVSCRLPLAAKGPLLQLCVGLYISGPTKASISIMFGISDFS